MSHMDIKEVSDYRDAFLREQEAEVERRQREWLMARMKVQRRER